MAIFNLNETSNNEFLDESRASARHGDISVKGIYDAAEPEINKKLSKVPTALLKHSFSNSVKQKHKDDLEKNANYAFTGAKIGTRLGEVITKNKDRTASKNLEKHKDLVKTMSKDSAKQLTGLVGKELNRRGVNVKDLASKAAAKGDKKRKAIKEACEYILSILDEE